MVNSISVDYRTGRIAHLTLSCRRFRTACVQAVQPAHAWHPTPHLPPHYLPFAVAHLTFCEQVGLCLPTAYTPPPYHSPPPCLPKPPHYTCHTYPTLGLGTSCTVLCIPYTLLPNGLSSVQYMTAFYNAVRGGRMCDRTDGLCQATDAMGKVGGGGWRRRGEEVWGRWCASKDSYGVA